MQSIFDEIWSDLADEAVVDSVGSAEYERIKHLFGAIPVSMISRAMLVLGIRDAANKAPYIPRQPPRGGD